jgi:hypothetical protein
LGGGATEAMTAEEYRLRERKRVKVGREVPGSCGSSP